MRGLDVVVAPDSFKGSLDAAAVAAQIARGWLEVRPQDTVTELPMADGGEGTIDAIAAAVPGSQRLTSLVEGPDSRPVQASWLRTPDGTAVVEIAQTSGITQSDLTSPLTASTFGLGQLIDRVLDDVATRRLTVCLGGSATTDAGAGALTALGLVLTDPAGKPVARGAAGLLEVSAIDAAQVRSAPVLGIDCLVDVTSPLLGDHGAARMFSPQKGASPHDVEVLEHALARFADLAGGAPERPGAGAAGGTAYGLATFLDARFVPGAEAVADLYDLGARLATADVVITGEGRFDAQSLRGKVVGHVLERSGGTRAEIALVAGQINATDPRFRRSCSLIALAGSAELAIRDPERHLRLAGRRLASWW